MISGSNRAEPRQAAIRCPACRAASLAPAGSSASAWTCAACGAAYPLVKGVLDLLPPSRERRTLAQLAMEWKPIVRIYESRLWRRSPLVAALTRISFEREYALIRDAAELRGDEALLDLACGTGIYARPLARSLPRGGVVGLDLSLPMLRHAARRRSEEGIENLTLVHASAVELPFLDSSLDVVNCCGALHLFHDADRVLAEAHRVLRPGGRLTVAAFRRREGRLAARAAELRRRLDGIGSFTPREVAARCDRAGLAGARCLHAAGVWLVMVARRG